MNSQDFLNLKNKAQTFRFENHRERIERIKKIKDWINLNEDRIIQALQNDFNKPAFETLISEIFPSLSEAHYTIRKLKKWLQDTPVRTSLGLIGHKSWIRHENKGVVLIISPWNYPFQLAVVPLIAALAAGNSVVIKPSELTGHTSELLRVMVEECFSPDVVRVELGDKNVTTELLKFNFDHVFFTGSTRVGKVVAQACAERLIPTTLELGGKSPVIVDETADLDEAVDKIFWSKYLNRAQTCVAPDYLLLHESVEDRFVKKLNETAQRFDESPKAKIITEAHHQRLKQMLKNPSDLNLRTLEVIKVENLNHPSMQDEIFGPVLPYFTYRDLSEVQNVINHFEKPLSLYVFSKNKKTVNYVLNAFPSGGAGINAVVVQFGNHHLPFGGIGHSGHGEYHGYYGFKQMSHARAVIKSSFLKSLRHLMMPPYSDFKVNILNLLKKLA